MKCLFASRPIWKLQELKAMCALCSYFKTSSQIPRPLSAPSTHNLFLQQICECILEPALLYCTIDYWALYQKMVFVLLLIPKLLKHNTKTIKTIYKLFWRTTRHFQAKDALGRVPVSLMVSPSLVLSVKYLLTVMLIRMTTSINNGVSILNGTLVQ